MHGTWNPPPEMQVLTGSYLKGAALGLPSALFLPHFPSTAPVTLRNAANEEWGGKVTRKPLKECNSCKLPPCCPFPNWLPASRDCVAHQRCLSLASPAPACRPVALYLLLAQGLSFQQEASHVGLFVPASARNHRPCNRSTFCTPACLPAVRLELTSGWGRFAKDNRLRAGDTVQVEYLPHHTLLITVVKHAVGGAAAAAGGASRKASKARKPAAAAAAAAVDADWSDADEQHQNLRKRPRLEKLQQLEPPQQQQQQSRQPQAPYLAESEPPYIRHRRGPDEQAGHGASIEYQQGQQQQRWQPPLQQLGSPYSGQYALPADGQCDGQSDGQQQLQQEPVADQAGTAGAAAVAAGACGDEGEAEGEAAEAGEEQQQQQRQQQRQRGRGAAAPAAGYEVAGGDAMGALAAAAAAIMPSVSPSPEVEGSSCDGVPLQQARQDPHRQPPATAGVAAAGASAAALEGKRVLLVGCAAA
jgi:hypothetical protein